MDTRIVSFGDCSVRLDYSGQRASEVVDFLFRDVPTTGGPEPHITLQLQAVGEDRLRFSCGDEAPFESGSAADLARALLERVTFHLSDRSRGGLLLHAAALEWKGRCVVLPGKTGIGKTTLTAWLVSKGFKYLSDELVYLPLGTRDVHGLARPLNIKVAGRSALDHSVLDLEAMAPRVLSGSRVMLVPASVLGGSVAADAGHLAAFVFPRYQRDARVGIEEVSKAQTALALMGCLINARNLPAHGFSEVTRLANEVTAFRLRYSAFQQIEDWIEQLMRSNLTDFHAGANADASMTPGSPARRARP